MVCAGKKKVPFASRPTTLRPMPDENPTKLVRRRRVQAYRGHGGIYAWLRAHHVQIAALRAAGQRSWLDVIAEMVRDEVRDQNGADPVMKNVSRVWKRVCLDVAKAADLKAKKRPIGGKFPSRISPDWRPEVVAPPPIRPALPAPVQAGAVASQADDDSHLTPEQREHVARVKESIQRQIDEHDRKFRFGGW